MDICTEVTETKKQLIAFIHDIGRVFPEQHSFLKMPKSVGDKAEEASNKNGAKNVDFDEMYSHIRDNLKRIDSQEVTITGILNEEYNGWYNGSGACQTPRGIV